MSASDVAATVAAVAAVVVALALIPLVLSVRSSVRAVATLRDCVDELRRTIADQPDDRVLHVVLSGAQDATVHTGSNGHDGGNGAGNRRALPSGAPLTSVGKGITFATTTTRAFRRIRRERRTRT